jgi:hypothetical protein
MAATMVGSPWQLHTRRFALQTVLHNMGTRSLRLLPGLGIGGISAHAPSGNLQSAWPAQAFYGGTLLRPICNLIEPLLQSFKHEPHMRSLLSGGKGRRFPLGDTGAIYDG